MNTRNDKIEYVECPGFIAEIIRTNRKKSADLRVEAGEVSVVVPLQLPTERIEKLLKDKRRWILEKLTLQRAALPATDKAYVSGEAFSYLGKNYRLKVVRGAFQPVKLSQGRLVATLPEGSDKPHMVRNALVRWYRKQAEKRLQEKAQRYSELLQVNPKSVGIQTFKARWGSCSSEGDIRLNWKIILAPHSICDYVVAHELCHLIQHDHSPAFWKAVSRVMPEYGKHKEWLKQNAERLEV